MADPVGSLYVELSASVIRFLADLKKAQGGLKDTQSVAEAFGKSFSKAIPGPTQLINKFTVAAVAVPAAILAMNKEASTFAESLGHLSQKTGVSQKDLQSWGVAMRHNNISQEQMAVGIRTLAQNMQEASNPTSLAAAAFNRLGLSVEDLKGRNPDEVMRLIADQVKQMPDGMQKAALMMELFGRAGQDLIPLMNEGSEAIDQAKRKVEELGASLSGAQLKTLQDNEQAWTNLGIASLGFSRQIGALVAPAVIAIIEKLTQWIGVTNNLVKAIQEGRPALEWFAKTFLKAQMMPGLPDPSQFLGRGMQEPKGPLAAPPVSEDIADQLAGQKRFITGEQQEVELGNLRVKQTQQATLWAEKLGMGFGEAWSITKRMTDQQFQTNLATELQAKKFMPAVLAMQGDIEKGQERENKLANDIFFTEQLSNKALEDRNFVKQAGLTFLQESFAIAGAEGREQARIGEQERDRLVVRRQLEESAARDLELAAMAANSGAMLAEASYAADRSMMKSNANVIAAKLNAIDAEKNARLAALDVLAIGEDEHFTRRDAIEAEASLKSAQLAQQYPSFWDKALDQINQGFAFAWGQVTNQISGAFAQQLVMGNDWAKTMQSLAVSVLQAFINMGIQMVVNWIAAQATITSAQVTGDATRAASNTGANSAIVASNAAAAGASVAVWTGASAAIVGAYAAVSAGFAAITGALVVAVTAAGVFVMGVLSAIAAALTATVFGIPYAGAILVGIGLIAAALAATDNLPKLKEGGITTGPTIALIGEGQENEVVMPLSRLDDMMQGVAAAGTGVAPMGNSWQQGGGFRQQIIVQMDGRSFIEANLDTFIEVLRLRGATI